MPPKKGSFEHFYLTKVALGDCCGCAERVIDWRDIEEAARAKNGVLPPPRISLLERWRRFRRSRQE